ncbi:MAG: enoyl-CoA hydratase/isomerase family protein [Chloroflexi bacterium]|nr:enoyl-CoA hydratase/isomerase family protein [Chloroflexota bacterium]
MATTDKTGPFKLLNITSDGAVAIIALANPPVNALSPALVDDISRALDHVEHDAAARAVVLTGGATRFFSAGADVATFVRHTHEQNVDYIRKGSALWDRLESYPKAVVAHVNGFAFGGGAELALACDVRVFAESARFGLPEVNLGILPGWGGMQRLSNLIGRGRALEVCLTGRQLDAKEALAVGVATATAPDAEAGAKAIAIAKQLAEKPPLAVREIKRRIADGAGKPLSESQPKDIEAFFRLINSQDAKEGLAAFLEKRPAKFTGK